MFTAPAHDPTDADPHGRAAIVPPPLPFAAVAQTLAGVAVSSGPARAALQKSVRASIRAVHPALSAGLRVAAGIVRAALRR